MLWSDGWMLSTNGPLQINFFWTKRFTLMGLEMSRWRLHHWVPSGALSNGVCRKLCACGHVSILHIRPEGQALVSEKCMCKCFVLDWEPGFQWYLSARPMNGLPASNSMHLEPSLATTPPDKWSELLRLPRGAISGHFSVRLVVSNIV